MLKTKDQTLYIKDQPCSEPASDIVDRRGIVKENETPFGVLIDVAEAFVNNVSIFIHLFILYTPKGMTAQVRIWQHGDMGCGIKETHGVFERFEVEMHEKYTQLI